jgi:hypothetical protein
MLRTSYSVLSTIAASAGDITTSQGFVSITGQVPMKYNLIRDAGVGYVLPTPEVLGSITVTPTVTVGLPSTLIIQQYVGGLGRTVLEVVTYTPITGDTASTVVAAWIAQGNLFKDLQIAFTGTTTLILTANASTAASMTIDSLSGISGTFNNAVITVTSQSGVNSVALTTAAIAITGVTTATPMVVSTGTTTGLVAGGLVAISGITTMTEANGVFRIGTVVGSTSFVILNQYTGANTVGVNTYGSGGTWVLGSQIPVTSTTSQTQGGQSRGYYWDLLAAGVSSSLLSTTGTYNYVIFTYGTNSDTDVQTSDINTQTLYVLSSATNFANFNTRMTALLSDLTSTSVADPLNASLV